MQPTQKAGRLISGLQAYGLSPLILRSAPHYGSEMEKIQIAYSLRIEGLLFNEITFSDVTPEFKNIILKPVDSHGDNTYELLISKYIYSTAAAQLKAIFYESTLRKWGQEMGSSLRLTLA